MVRHTRNEAKSCVVKPFFLNETLINSIRKRIWINNTELEKDKDSIVSFKIKGHSCVKVVSCK